MDMMCWLCYREVDRSVKTVGEWKCVSIKGYTFYTCPECQKEEQQDDAE